MVGIAAPMVFKLEGVMAGAEDSDPATRQAQGYSQGSEEQLRHHGIRTQRIR